ncbi:hypothetical protein BGZ65_010030, partial [Modicella reniformis]
MTKTACSRALGIPELLHLITAYLSQADLLACVQVNNQWNIHFIPKLWHTIDDSLQSWEIILLTCHSDPNIFRSRISAWPPTITSGGHSLERILFTRHSDLNNHLTRSKLSAEPPSSITNGKDEVWIRGIFAKYGHHIRRLKVRWIILVDAASTSGVCTNIQDLEINLNTENDRMICRKTEYEDDILAQNQRFQGVFEPPIPHLNKLTKAIYPSFMEEVRSGLVFTQHYWDLILANRRLRRLCLLNKPLLQWTVKSNEFIYDLLRGMKELQELCAINIVNMNLLWKLQELAPTVESVTVNKIYMFPGDHDSIASEDGFNA